MKFKHKTLVFLAGLVWLLVGVVLLSVGTRFVLETLRQPLLTQLPHRFSVIQLLGNVFSNTTQCAMITIILALLIGMIKGRTVLAKSVKRQIKRIESLPEPASCLYLYDKSYYLLIAFMVLLGIGLRFSPITLDTRGAIDMVIGSALINGAMLYFRKLPQFNHLKKQEHS
jgi:hypothetical protein